MKTKSINKITVAMILAVMMIISVFGIITLNNAVSAEVGINPLKGDVIVGDATGEGTKANPYTEKPWYGRIMTKENMYDNYYIEINVDPRNTIFVDDIIIEYNYFYLDSSYKRVSTKLPYFKAYIKYYEKGTGKVFTDTVSKSNDNAAGFTKNSSSTKINKVEVEVTVKATNSIEKTFYYKFIGE